jgi:hypothetical protein
MRVHVHKIERSAKPKCPKAHIGDRQWVHQSVEEDFGCHGAWRPRRAGVEVTGEHVAHPTRCITMQRLEVDVLPAVASRTDE